MAGTRLISPTARNNIAIGAFVAVAAVLSMSGSMPAVWRTIVAWTLRLGSAIEHRLSINFIDRSDLGFQSDEIGHLILWGSGMIFVGLSTRHRFRADVVAVSLFAASLALEFAQGAFAPSRSMTVGDIIANATGIMAGLSVVVIIDSVLSLASRWRPKSPQPSQPEIDN